MDLFFGCGSLAGSCHSVNVKTMQTTVRGSLLLDLGVGGRGERQVTVPDCDPGMQNLSTPSQRTTGWILRYREWLLYTVVHISVAFSLSVDGFETGGFVNCFV